MDRFIAILILTLIGQVAFCQKGDPLISPEQFMGIKLGETNFTDAGEILNIYSYKEPRLHFRTIRWRDGSCTTLLTHHYFIKTKNSKIHIVLYGYNSVNRIQISCNVSTKLSFLNLTLGKSRIRDIKFTGDKWEETIDSNGKTYLTNEFNGIRIDILGDTPDIRKENWVNKKINQITLIKADE